MKTSIREKNTGKLAGKRIAIKDSVMIAGVPMMNGSNLLEGFVPQVDAEVVTRILNEGGEIVGKTTCEYLCLSGGSHTSANGPVINPWKKTTQQAARRREALSCWRPGKWIWPSAPTKPAPFGCRRRIQELSA